MKRVLLVLIIVVAAVFLLRENIVRSLFKPTDPGGERGISINDPITTDGIDFLVNQRNPNGDEEASPQEFSSPIPDLEVVTEDLVIPWEVEFLPDSELLVTERPGNLLRIGSNQEKISINGVEHVGEGGLLGLALHPNFSENQFVYLYLTTSSGNGLINRVERYQLVDDKLINRTLIIDQIPGAQFHDGGRIKFGPDGLLYITTGDAGNSANAQNLNSLAGKILRLNDDGGIPEGNPFGTAVYSYGHRNPQGLAWDDQGRLWATEHGRSGNSSGLDELNLIERGKNYGWPTIQGDQKQSGLVTPVLNSGPDVTWAPAGAAYWSGSIFFGGLRGESLYEAQIDGEEVKLIAHFNQEFGRIRAVDLGPDGFLYITTSNRDGRGDVREGDDKIIKINPQIFR